MFCVDVLLPFHAKIGSIPRKIRTRAMGLWLFAGCWSRWALTCGVVPRGQVAQLGGTKAEAEALVTATLWERTADGYKFHDWPDWQESLEEVEVRRERERLKKAAWRKRRAAKLSTVDGDQLSTDNVVDMSTKTVHQKGGQVPWTLARGRGSHSHSHSQRESEFVAAAPITAKLKRGTTESGGGDFFEPAQTESETRATDLTQALLDVLREQIHVPEGKATERALRRLQGWLTLNHPRSSLEAAERLVAAFSRDEWASTNGFPIADLAKRPERYFPAPDRVAALKDAAGKALASQDVEGWRRIQAEIRTLQGDNHGTR